MRFLDNFSNFLVGFGVREGLVRHSGPYSFYHVDSQPKLGHGDPIQAIFHVWGSVGVGNLLLGDLFVLP